MTERADIIIVHARVLTMDESNPRAQAIAIRGNRIMAVGSTVDIADLKSPTTRVIDAAGCSVLPGFIEAHMHLFSGAAEIDNLGLISTFGLKPLIAALSAYAARHPNKRLLIANQTNYPIISESEPLSRHHLDMAVPDRPLICVAPDHHTAWANTAALRAAGILYGRDLPVGNEIVMGPDGMATGELRESEAIKLVYRLKEGGNRDRLGLETGGEPSPPVTREERAYDRSVIRRGLDYCASFGITSIHNMDGNFYTCELLDDIDREGGFTARAEVPYHFKNFMPLSNLEKASELSRRYASDRLHSGRVKMFIDGVLDNWTGVMVEPYSDRPGHHGELLFTPKHFAEVATGCDARGLQISVHAIGDGAVRTVLDGYAAARSINGVRDSRHRIEHIEVIHPTDVDRFKALGVIASMQPLHAPGQMGLPLEPTLSRIGDARWPYAYAWRTLKSAGARLVLSSDWPISALNPLVSIGAAMTRKVWREGLPDHRLSLHEAIAGYTRDAAFAEFHEDRKGMLKRGMLADLVVLGADIEAQDPEAIKDIPVRTTICDGKVTFDPASLGRGHDEIPVRLMPSG
jgi:predicted amidohydrolase YtcJ